MDCCGHVWNPARAEAGDQLGGYCSSAREILGGLSDSATGDLLFLQYKVKESKNYPENLNSKGQIFG